MSTDPGAHHGESAVVGESARGPLRPGALSGFRSSAFPSSALMEATPRSRGVLHVCREVSSMTRYREHGPWPRSGLPSDRSQVVAAGWPGGGTVAEVQALQARDGQPRSPSEASSGLPPPVGFRVLPDLPSSGRSAEGDMCRLIASRQGQERPTRLDVVELDVVSASLFPVVSGESPPVQQGRFALPCRPV